MSFGTRNTEVSNIVSIVAVEPKMTADEIVAIKKKKTKDFNAHEFWRSTVII